MATPQQLIDFSGVLTDFAVSLSNFADNHPVPTSSVAQAAADTAGKIADDADLIGHIGLDAMSDGLSYAISQLAASVSQAKESLQEINNFKQAISIGAAVLSVAASIASGNILGSAQNVLALVTTIQSAVKANSSSP